MFTFFLYQPLTKKQNNVNAINIFYKFYIYIYIYYNYNMFMYMYYVYRYQCITCNKYYS